MARFEAIEGNYTGTSDDAVGRWYIVDRDADVIDKRGAGYPSREAALEALVERLTIAPLLSDLVGQTEIAQRAGTTPGTIDTWRRRHADFPEPLARLAAGNVWRWEDVAAWLAIPRKPGRPRKVR